MSLWQDRKVVICVGTGGVGKTTVSAAIAIAAAAAGKRTLVMTIDPARRLANAMGLARFGNVEREVPAEALAECGVELKAPLWVMMPDVKRTFDELIERISPSEERRQQILHNRIYQQFSTVLSGSLEYAAVEKLYEVHASRRYDLIVLDTPPSPHAVDFLEAPSRILDFLEHETLQWLLKPYVLAGKFSLKILDIGSSFILRTLGRMAGSDTIRELAEFVMGFQGMYDGFRERSQHVRRLLASDELAFALVASTQPHQTASMLQFRRQLMASGLRVRGVVLNRVLPAIDTSSSALEEALGSAPAEIRSALVEAAVEEIELARRDRRAAAQLAESLPDTPSVILPELPLEVNDLRSLAQLQAYFAD